MAEGKEFRPGYTITRSGQLYSTKRGEKKKVATREDKDGYLRANIGKEETVYIHKLVAKAFCKGSGLVLHKDGNKKNNKASNLEYGTHKENRKQREEHRTDAIWRKRWDSEHFKIQSWEETPEGYLKLLGVSAYVGELIYPRADGTSQVEEVVPSALDGPSVESLLHKPVTLEHPLEGEVTAQNHKEVSKGMVVEVKYDAEKQEQQVAVVLTDPEAIAGVKSKEYTMFSPGYEASLIKLGDGRYRQIGRKNNHLALTKAGRAGPRAGLRPRLDSESHIIQEDQMTENEDKNDALEDMKKKMDSMAEEMKKKDERMDAMQAKLDAYEEAEKARKDEKKEKKTDSEFVAQFNFRMDALGVAKRVGLDVDDEWTNRQLKEEIVSKLVSGKRYDSDVALDAAYETAIDLLPDDNDGSALGRAMTEGRNDSRQRRLDSEDTAPKPDPRSAQLANYGNAFSEGE